MILLLLACQEAAVEDHQCTGPLIELLKWRDGESGNRRIGKGLAPDALRAAELSHIAAAVEAMRPHADHCGNTWRMGLWSKPDNPGMRVRDEAIRSVLGEPPIDYVAEAWEGSK